MRAGLAPGRDVVLVADSGNDRVVLLARTQLRTVEAWDGWPGGSVASMPGTPSWSRRPVVSLTPGPSGRGVRGRLAAGPPLRAAEVAVAGRHLVVLDTAVASTCSSRRAPRARRAQRPGRAARARGQWRRGAARRQRQPPLAAFAARAPPRRGPGLAGPVAAVAVDRRGGVLVLPGSGGARCGCPPPAHTRQRGVLWGGPFRTRTTRARHVTCCARR